jgi:hypothetical protein
LHNPKKCTLEIKKDHKTSGREGRKCRCPIWISGVGLHLNRKTNKYEIGNIKESTKLRDWTRAEACLRHYEDKGIRPVETSRTEIKELATQFLANAGSPTGKNLGPATLIKYNQLLKPLLSVRTTATGTSIS